MHLPPTLDKEGMRLVAETPPLAGRLAENFGGVSRSRLTYPDGLAALI